ncbi:DUF4138 domain-containing protein [Zunongwangia sp. SCSIO 43204]|uniref:DUF4138 domain-containing protein n=1 Tax=Zunongwangia sp. SCSIO 43204 TaxID=2779359 RepID=UPI001CA97FB8|nr:DUF4138 domain-containing protein [Zunongwangia sp. SCSIO 43204]UAB83158.1 DUF4138 domain-containing protein [Zunongwangia sp. SCSIO 43204]
MRTFTIILLLALISPVNAQKALDTLYANDKKNVALFFPSAIRQGITGASNFVFTYNREKRQYFGLLQAQPGEESNLLVVTDDGKVFSYMLKYTEELPKINYFISADESIGTEIPAKVIPKPSKEKKYSLEKRQEYFQRFSEYLMKSGKKQSKTKRKRGIKLQLQRITYNASETYLVMELTNTSGITFEIDFLKIYRVSGNKKRKSSFQKLEMKPIYTYKMPSNIYNSQSVRLVYVLPKFVLGSKEKLQLELRELNGRRKILLRKRL